MKFIDGEANVKHWNPNEKMKFLKMDNMKHECEGIKRGDTDANQRYNRVCDKDRSKRTEANGEKVGEEPTEANEEKVG
jgi:hypothetical protein